MISKIFTLLISLGFTCQIQSQNTIGEKLDSLIDGYTRLGKFNGCALVASHNRILLEKGYGFKNVRDSTLNDPNTLFQIASVTKQFTSAVILKLVELQKLALNDKLSKFYPDFPKGDKINIENLLTHTSGIYDWTNNNMNFSPTGEQSLLAFLKTKNLDFPPGTEWGYSNSNYSLLGYIIQKVTGISYEDAVRNYIFKPLDMTHSGFDFKHLKSRDKAAGYSTFSEKNKIEGTLYDSVGPFAAGEIYSTIGDLYKWHLGLQSNLIVSKSTLEKAYMPFRDHYGYGWQIDSLYGKKVVSHSGSISGFCSNLARITEESTIVILLNNKEGSGLENLTKKVFAVLYDKPYSIPVRRPVEILGKQTLKKYIGKYNVNSHNGPVLENVTFESGKLKIQAPGGPKLELIAEKENHFYTIADDYECEVDFKTDSIGEVDKITISQYGITMSGTKMR
jgi:CubicO group peptidase (beta-lactamase class C family)